MRQQSKIHRIVLCACGRVEFEALGEPIVSAVCYCDDCQEGGRHIQALPRAQSVLDPDGGSSYVLYRKDRMHCSKGDDVLRDFRIRETSPTRRVVASCCNTAMFLDFQKGHWYSVYRARFDGAAPPVQMRIQTRFKPENSTLPDDVPTYPGYAFGLIAKLLSARVAMLLHR